MVRMVLCCVVLFVLGGTAHAISLDEQGCRAYGAWAADTLWAKSVGADKEKVRAYFQSRSEPYFKLILIDFDKLWDLPIEMRRDVFQAVYGECVQRRGQYGTET